MNDQNLEIVPANAVESMTRAEVDVAIATARKYPRQLPAVKQSMMSFATLDQETAEGCFYSLPRGGKVIQGPSVRLAEIAVSCYGNLQAGSRIIAVDSHSETPHVVVQAIAKDLEKNITISVEKRRRITKKRNKDTIDEDDINLAANACSAICFRDAVFKVVPLALIKPVFEAARKVAIGDARTLNDRRARCLDTFAKMGVPKEKVLAKLELKSVEQIDLSHLETLIGLHNAIKEGEVNIDEAFAVSAATTAHTGPATTEFQQAQQTAPVQEKPDPEAKKPAATKAPASKKVEKFTPEEALSMIESGTAVAPSAIQGGMEAVEKLKAEREAAKQPAQEPAGGEMSAEDAAELAAAGLAPEPAQASEPEATKPEPPAEAESDKPKFVPVPGESKTVTEVRKLAFDSQVSEEQIMRFMQTNKFSAGEVKLTDFTANSREAKLQAIIRVWATISPKIKAIKL